jgi:energy-coupling factor transporter ATP-binding protein EcfA2
MIRVKDLSVWYGDLPALLDVSFEVEQGECVLVTGPSGCGKSTLGRALTGLIPHAIPARLQGSVEVEGRLLSESTLPELAGSIGMVFQNPSSQLFHLRVSDEIAFGPRNLGLSEAEVQERVSWALDATGLEDLREATPADLSGGQKQKVAIAAALAMRPRLLVLDEPTASLDVPGAQLVIQTLQDLRRDNHLTIVIIEHRLAEVARLCERAMILDEGRIIVDGPFQRVLGDPANLSRFGLRRPVETAPVPWRQLLQPNGHPDPGNSLLLELKGVSAGYRHQAVLQDVDLELYTGEFIALVGENGAGKTTLALTAAGLLKPCKGRVSYCQRRNPMPGLDIALLFQNPLDQLFNDSVEEEVAFAPCNYARFDSAAHEQTLIKTDLLALRQRSPLTLSTGQQQRTALAACLSLGPRLLILDEPTLGQDWRHLEEMMGFLQTLNRSGTTILLISHDYKLVHRFARRVILLEHGRIALDGRVPESEEEDLEDSMQSLAIHSLVNNKKEAE